MILSGIQVMLPALGLDWNEEYEELSELKKSSNVIVQPTEWSWEMITLTYSYGSGFTLYSDSVVDDE
ncbi:MAG: hypothetical protein VX613_00995, partial [Candidatus Thermoplasmatota archaeon]|nr:hypothetical protein [Candidatus Thermoplasmatota archaeon]